MQQLRNFADIRQTCFCVFCGKGTETRDHVPSKIFLEKPYPENLPVIPACQLCNESFSLDEEYMGCLVECALHGTVKVDKIERNKIKKILNRKPALVSRLQQAHQNLGDGSTFNVETERVRKIVLKLARGHVAFEFNEPQLDNPTSISYIPFSLFTSIARKNFETTPISLIWPEVGSRAMQRMVSSEPRNYGWQIVQEGRYRYLVFMEDKVVVRMVISEYLACEVIWSHN